MAQPEAGDPLVLDRRAMDPARFAHLRQELGQETPEEAAVE
jgi:hypothetical protein